MDLMVEKIKEQREGGRIMDLFITIEKTTV